MDTGPLPAATVVGTETDGWVVGTVVAGAGSVVGGELEAGVGRTEVCGIVSGGGLVIETALCEGLETATATAIAAAAAAVAAATPV